MNRKRIISAVLVLLSVLVCSSACQAADSPRQETESTGEAADLLQEAESTGEGAATSQPAESFAQDGSENAVTAIGEFDFAGHTVLLSSGYTMPIMGLGTYSLDYDTCVNSVKTLLENGGDQRSGPQ